MLLFVQESGLSYEYKQSCLNLKAFWRYTLNRFIIFIFFRLTVQLTFAYLAFASNTF